MIRNGYRGVVGKMGSIREGLKEGKTEIGIYYIKNEIKPKGGMEKDKEALTEKEGGFLWIYHTH